jgi:hypothetical protein
MGRGGAESNQGHRLRGSVDPASLLYGRDPDPEGLEVDQVENSRDPEPPAAEGQQQVAQPSFPDLDRVDDLIRNGRIAARKAQVLQITERLRELRERQGELDREHQEISREIEEEEGKLPSFDQQRRDKRALLTLEEQKRKLQARGDLYRRIGDRASAYGLAVAAPVALGVGLLAGPVAGGAVLPLVFAPILLAARALRRRAPELGSRDPADPRADLPEGQYLAATREADRLEAKIKAEDEIYRHCDSLQSRRADLGHEYMRLNPEIDSLEKQLEQLVVKEVDPDEVKNQRLQELLFESRSSRR